LGKPGVKNVHFIGIGGVSMSGLAQILHARGYHVTGSDAIRSETTDYLSRKGIHVSIGHDARSLPHADLVVYTAAIDNENPELCQARKLSVPVISRAALLGEIMDEHRYGIAVAGTHGKTTTTSMISVIMLKAGKDPTIHIGGRNDIIGGSVKIGGINYFITEADEYCGSFLELTPSVAVILNMEHDHVDYYPDIKHVSDSFLEFVKHVPAKGYVIGNGDDKEVCNILEKVDSNICTFGISSPECFYRAADISFDADGCASFTLLKNGARIASLTLKVAGIHNIYNALAASAACYTAGCNTDEIREGLASFHGARRRLEKKGSRNDVRVLDDYAHHPSEIKATLAAVRMLSAQRVWCVFQPHTYSRTCAFLSQFAESFTDADGVIVMDIYAAREKDTGIIHSTSLADRINLREKGKALYINDFDEAVNFLKSNTSPGDVIITMGAGDVYRVGELFLNS
jgi:UDP-N-acetylmuramate--alanine ligase